MKKLCLILAVVLCLTCAAAVAEDAKLKPAEVVGVWCAVEATHSDDAYFLLAPATMEFKRDGTAVFTSESGDVTEYTWKFSSDSTYLQLEGDKTLRVEQGENGTLLFDPHWGEFAPVAANTKAPLWLTYVFTKNADDANVINLGKVVEAAEEDPFFGNWQVVYILNDQNEYAMQAAGDDNAYEIKIEFAQVEFSLAGGEPVTLMTDFVNGALTAGEAGTLTLTDQDFLLIEYVQHSMGLGDVTYSVVAQRVAGE